MKQVLLCTMVIFGLILSNSAFAKSKKYHSESINGVLPGITKVELKKVSGDNYLMSFINTLNEKEIVYKKTKILFIIDNKPYEYIFKLYIKLSNTEAEEKATVSLTKQFLIEIIESNKTFINIGDKRKTKIDNVFKEKMAIMLHKKK